MSTCSFISQVICTYFLLHFAFHFCSVCITVAVCAGVKAYTTKLINTQYNNKGDKTKAKMQRHDEVIGFVAKSNERRAAATHYKYANKVQFFQFTHFSTQRKRADWC